MTNKSQFIKNLNFKNFCLNCFEFMILGFGTYLLLVSWDLEITNRITNLNWKS